MELKSWCTLFSPIFTHKYKFKDILELFLEYEISRDHNTSYEDYGYYIWNGNICHILCLCIGNNEEVEGIIDYIEFLYFICKYKKINTLKLDYRIKSPYMYYKENNISGKWDSSMILILLYPLGTIERMQAYIRGYICRRRILRERYKKCINDIIYAPRGHYGKHFHGGIEYIQYIDKYINM